MSKRITIRDLQKISTEAIEALDGPTPVKSGERTVAILTPLKKANVKRLKKTLLETERLARGRNRADDDAAIQEYGDRDQTDWSFAATRASRRPSKKAR